MKVFVCLLSLMAIAQAGHLSTSIGGYAKGAVGWYANNGYSDGSGSASSTGYSGGLNNGGYNAGYNNEFNNGFSSNHGAVKIIKVVPQGNHAGYSGGHSGHSSSFDNNPSSSIGYNSNNAGYSGHHSGYSGTQDNFSGTYAGNDIKTVKEVYEDSGLLDHVTGGFSAGSQNRYFAKEQNAVASSGHNEFSNGGFNGYSYIRGANQAGFSSAHASNSGSQTGFASAPYSNDIKVIKVFNPIGSDVSYRGSNIGGLSAVAKGSW